MQRGVSLYLEMKRKLDYGSKEKTTWTWFTASCTLRIQRLPLDEALEVILSACGGVCSLALGDVGSGSGGGGGSTAG